MAFDYSKFVLLAQEKIGDTGRAIKVQKLSATPADAAKPWKGPASPTVATEVDTVGTFLEIFSFLKLGLEVIDENLLKRVDQVVLIPQVSTDIKEYDTIVDGSVTWKIDWVRLLKPGDTILLYWVGVKR